MFELREDCFKTRNMAGTLWLCVALWLCGSAACGSIMPNFLYTCNDYLFASWLIRYIMCQGELKQERPQVISCGF